MSPERSQDEAFRPDVSRRVGVPPHDSYNYSDPESIIIDIPLATNVYADPMLRLRHLYVNLGGRSKFKAKLFNITFTILLSIMAGFMYLHWHFTHVEELRGHTPERVLSFLGLVIAVMVVPLVIVERMLDAGRGMDRIELLQRRILRLLDGTSLEAVDAGERGFETVVRELEDEAEETLWKTPDLAHDDNCHMVQLAVTQNRLFH